MLEIKETKSLKNDILSSLDIQPKPITIGQLTHWLISKYSRRDVLEEVWDLAADGHIRIGFDWKITRSNDGGYF